MKIRFTKMQAYGNDYVYINAISQKITDVNELARLVSDRHFAIGSDGMVLICEPTVKEADFRMRMFNPDGSEGEMCGNALRSLSKYVYDHRLTDKEELVIETLGGLQYVTLETRDRVAVNITADIGKPRLKAAGVPVNTTLEEFIDVPVHVIDRDFNITAMSWGNPHCVMFVDSLEDLEVEKYGKTIEHMTELFPNKINVTFAKVISRDHLAIREWERGTGETIGCGTGCCTAFVAAVTLGMCDKAAAVTQIGGDLSVRWAENDHIFMKGPSHTVFEASIEVGDLCRE